MTQKRDYYETLGVDRAADASAIKKAFRSLALKYHPDRNKAPDAKERFQEIAEAYAVLHDPKKRAQYDARGHAGVAGFSAEDLFGGIDFGDILSGLGFGFGRRAGMFGDLFGFHSRPKRGENINTELAVSLECVAKGGEEIVKIHRPTTCAACKGSGAEAGTEPRKCERCDGRGNLVHAEERGRISFQQVTTCSQCGGKGTIIDKPCPACQGTGETFRDEQIKVKIPAGIEDGMALRVKGHGMPTPTGGTAPGDLLVIIRTRHDPRFERRGADLWRKENVPIADAVLGTSIRVPRLDGKEVSVKVPPGTQAGETLRLRGKGLPRFHDKAMGDMFIELSVVVPKRLSPQERELFERLRDLTPKAHEEKKVQ
jgi:molecular chaperone DnaJ